MNFKQGTLSRTTVDEVRAAWVPRAISWVQGAFEEEKVRMKMGGWAAIDPLLWQATLWVIWRNTVAAGARMARDALAQEKAVRLDPFAAIEAAKIIVKRSSYIVATTESALFGESLDTLDDVYDEWSYTRAFTIGETEALSGIAYGAHNVARQTATLRVWRSQGDSLVRDTHQEADGQIRRYDEPFIVGGAYLNYPNDPSGPAEEVINCRCWEDPLR